MLDPSITNLLSTLLGGALATIGMCTANIVNSKISQKKEQRDILRNKVEEIYSCIQEMNSLDDKYNLLLAEYLKLVGVEYINLKSEDLSSNRIQRWEIFKKCERNIWIYLPGFEPKMSKWAENLKILEDERENKISSQKYAQRDLLEDTKSVTVYYNIIHAQLIAYFRKKGMLKI